MVTNLVPVYFKDINDRERGEFAEQIERIKDMYSDVATLLDPVEVGSEIPKQADAIVFPQLVGAAFREVDGLRGIDLPFIVLTSKYGTVEMWDWEIVTYLRTAGLNVFSPYNVELAKVILRAVSAKSKLASGAKFLMFQDSPGEGMQANIFKRFYWWEDECIQKMKDTFGMQLIYKSWKEVCESAKLVSDENALEACKDWDVCREGLSDENYLRGVKIYVAVKAVIEELGGVEGVGSNCLNESFNSDTTPCLAWNMLFEKDDIIFACEGDTLTMLSTFILYRSLQAPIMMTNIYPFLVGMAALAHEKIDKFPDIDDPDNHALGVHCGYFGLAARQFCTSWTLRDSVLEIVDENALVVDCEMPVGKITLAKIHPDFKKLSVIRAEIEEYVQYPGSDCRNGALIRYEDGHKVMDALCSHHALIIVGDKVPELKQLAKIFDWEVELL